MCVALFPMSAGPAIFFLDLSPSSLCSDSSQLTVTCFVQGNHKSVSWRIKSSLSESSITFTSAMDKPKGVEGHAMANVFEHSINTIGSVLLLQVKQLEVPYTINCLDPFTRLTKEVTIGFRGDVCMLNNLLKMLL